MSSTNYNQVEQELNALESRVKVLKSMNQEELMNHQQEVIDVFMKIQELKKEAKL